MTYYIYSIRDIKTGFMIPTMDNNDESAFRNFAFSIGNSDSLFTYFPSDFSLYCLAAFDSDSGLISPLSLPRYVGSGTDAFKLFKSGDLDHTKPPKSLDKDGVLIV